MNLQSHMILSNPFASPELPMSSMSPFGHTSLEGLVPALVRDMKTLSSRIRMSCTSWDPLRWDISTNSWGRKKHTGPWFNIKMSSYQYRESHCEDKTVMRSSYLHNGNSSTGKMASLYWINPLITSGSLIDQFLSQWGKGLHIWFYVTCCYSWAIYIIISYIIQWVSKRYVTPRLKHWSDIPCELSDTTGITLRGYPAKRALSAMRKHGG